MIKNASCANRKMTRKLLVLLPPLTTGSEAAAQQSGTPVNIKSSGSNTAVTVSIRLVEPGFSLTVHLGVFAQ